MNDILRKLVTCFNPHKTSMDNPAPNQTCVLKVGISCCKGCQKKVETALLKTDGVHSITTDAEKGIVTVLGTADPKTLIKVLARKRKRAEVISLEDFMAYKNQEEEQLKMHHSDKEKPRRRDKKNSHQKEKTQEEKKVQDCHCEDKNEHSKGKKYSDGGHEQFMFGDHEFKNGHVSNNNYNRRVIIGNDVMPQYRHDNLYMDSPLYQQQQYPSYGNGVMNNHMYYGGYRNQQMRPMGYGRSQPQYDPYYSRMAQPSYAYGYGPRGPM